MEEIGCAKCAGLRAFGQFRYCPNAFTEKAKLCNNYDHRAQMNFEDLHDEQKNAINFILNNKVGCIAPECGSGKTVIGLTAFVGIKILLNDPRMLVVSTPMGIKETWSKEHLKWGHLKDLKLAVLTGDKRERETILSCDWMEHRDVFCVSYNNLQWLLTWLSNNEHDIRFDFVFADEGSCLKGHDSKWRKILEQLSKEARYKIISTATPAPHDAMDYWGLCKYLDSAKCLAAPTITRFRELYCHAIPLPNRVGQRYELRRGASEEIRKKVAHLFYTFKITKEIPIEEINVWEELSDKSLNIYQKLEKEQCINSIVTTEIGQLDREESLDSLSLANKLAQLANGFVYVDDALRLSEETLQTMTERETRLLLRKKARNTLYLFNDRIFAFFRMLKAIEEKHGKVPVAIAYLFKHDLSVLKEYFPEGVADTARDIVERWNAGKIKYLFLQYARSAKALNLQAGGNILAVYSPTWNWEHDYQIVRRLARQGQPKEKVFVYRLWMKQTVDEQKFDVLKERGEGHKSFQKLVAQRASESRIS